ncbi:unnamed protein product [Hermetia illucens]|uniref:Uncharacterized protein n=2 Tax=Hermetia illucens TaxID=343691 RepID=A0A7R8YN73_HERIL|nr:unnamed protein product [Hermetia illucens]
MFIRPVFVLMFLGILLINESEGTLLKAKIIAAKKPLLLAKGVVAKEVAVKVKTAAKQTAAAAKATAAAVKSIALAPFKVAKKTIGIKVAAVKAAKALKLAKIARLLQGGPSQLARPQGLLALLPIRAISGLGLPLSQLRAKPAGGAVLQSLLPGVSSLLSRKSLFPSLRNSEDTERITTHSSIHSYEPQPIYRIYPERPYNEINFTPNVHVEYPPQQTITIQEPSQEYGLPSP